MEYGGGGGGQGLIKDPRGGHRGLPPHHQVPIDV